MQAVIQKILAVNYNFFFLILTFYILDFSNDGGYVKDNFASPEFNSYGSSGVEGGGRELSSGNYQSTFDYEKKPRKQVFEAQDNNNNYNSAEAIEQTIGEDESAESVGGIPLDTIKELVSEAITAAQHHKEHMANKMTTIKSNQKHYGSVDSVVWGNQHDGKENIDQNEQQYEVDSTNNSPVDHPIVKHVLDEIENNPNFLDNAHEVKANIGQELKSEASAPTSKEIMPKNRPKSKQMHRKTNPIASSTISVSSTSIASTATTTISPTTAISESTTSRNERLSGLLKKGFFGSIVREVGGSTKK